MLKKIWNIITDRNLWWKVDYFAGPKSQQDAKKPLTKEDILPLSLAFISIFAVVYVIILVVSFISWIFHRI